MAKGSSFEREVSKLLSLWFSEGKRDDLFWRTPGSGGRATSRNKAGKSTKGQYGDIFASDIEGKILEDNWNIELKTGYSKKSKKDLTDKKGKRAKIIYRWDILDLIDSDQKTPTFISFWNQTERDAKLSYRIPILIFRRNNRSICIALNKIYFSFLIDFFGNPNSVVIQINADVCIMSLNSFFEWIPNIKAALIKGESEDGE